MAETPGETNVSAEIDIPGEILVDATMLIVSYIGEDGSARYAWTAGGGSQSRAAVVGLLEIIQHQIIEGDV